MKVPSNRMLVVFGLATAAGLGALAACGSSGAGNGFSGDDGGGPGSSGGGGGNDAAGGQDSTLGGSSSGSSSGSSGGSSSGSGLVMYDGPPPNVDGGMLACSTPDGLPIKFNPIYSGYDGTHTYQVPAFVAGSTNPGSITWGSSDPSKVSFAPYITGIMITTLAAGDVTIIATAGGKCGTAQMHITSYMPSDWDNGNSRYNNGTPLNFTTAGAGLPSGILDAGIDGNYDASAVCTDPTFANLMNPFEGPPPAECTNCHGANSTGTILGMTLYKDVQHTPEQTGGFSDDDLTNVVVNGTIPDGGYFESAITPYCLWQRWHKWQDIDSGAAQAGIRSYLRALKPQEQIGCFELLNMNMCADGGM